MDTSSTRPAPDHGPPSRQDLLRDPVVARLASGRESAWFRGTPTPAADVLRRSPEVADRVEGARARFRRFAPWFLEHFPASAPTDGILESPLVRAPALQAEMDRLIGRRLPGRLWVKRDDALPVSGSVKARGGIHEVLEVAERVAAQAGPAPGRGDAAAADAAGAAGRDGAAADPTEHHGTLDTPQARAAFAEHGIAVGSTGNLGLSIGIVASELGFRTTVHMSVDARAWKKDLLRSRGVEVVEHRGDFSAAVEAGRRSAAADPSVHFVDDESSLALFSGYAVAGRRLAGQLAALDVPVDADHPLIVHLPCGVGGGPGGVAYGLKLAFGDHVHCLFAEPTAAPAMSLGVRTGLHGGISVQEIGLDGRTTADGLAVGRPSQVVGELVEDLVAGYLTVSDARLQGLVEVVHRTQSWPVEPSATAGLPGPWVVTGAADFRAAVGIDERALERANHVVWSTGGSMVPEAEMRGYREAGRAALESLDWR